MYVYISGPMSQGDRGENIKNGIKAAEKIFKLGCKPYIPHLTFYWEDLYSHSWEEWLGLDEDWILRCDAVLRIPGYSPGGDREVRFANEHSIPVYFSLGELETALEHKKISTN